MTFSIISYDRNTKQIGSAIASKWLAVGAFIPVYRKNIGVVHAQSLISRKNAENYLNLREQGQSPEDAINQVLQCDEQRDHRQYLICHKDGSFYAYSGDKCRNHFRTIIGDNCIAGGNLLASDNIIDEMIKTYEDNANLQMAERLLLALEKAQELGGDSRGQESASIRIYNPDYPNTTEHSVDLRVDNHDTPLIEMRKLLNAFRSGDRTVK